MKIGVNARLLGDEYTGIGQYTRCLFRELAKIDPDNQYFLIVPFKVSPKIEAEFPKNVKIVVLSEPKFGSKGFKKTFWEQFTVLNYFVTQNVDIAYFTYPANPWVLRSNLKNMKIIVTAHDCVPWKNEDYRRGFMSGLYHRQTKKALARADKVITVSQTSRGDISKICSIDEKKIEVVYNDAGDVYKSPIDFGEINPILKKFGLLRGGYFFYCGGYDKRKNVRGLVDEYNLYCDKVANPLPLVLAGEGLYKNELYDDFQSVFCGAGMCGGAGDEAGGGAAAGDEAGGGCCCGGAAGFGGGASGAGDEASGGCCCGGAAGFGGGASFGGGAGVWVNGKQNLSRGKIIATGFIDENELKALYSGCRSFVHFSKDEGFNIPLLEAANCGCLLLLSDIPIHREIAGDNALFVDLSLRGELSKNLLRLANTDEASLISLKELSKNICKRFSWKKSAQKIKNMLSLCSNKF